MQCRGPLNRYQQRKEKRDGREYSEIVQDAGKKGEEERGESGEEKEKKKSKENKPVGGGGENEDPRRTKRLKEREIGNAAMSRWHDASQLRMQSYGNVDIERGVRKK